MGADRYLLDARAGLIASRALTIAPHWLHVRNDSRPKQAILSVANWIALILVGTVWGMSTSYTQQTTDFHPFLCRCPAWCLTDKNTGTDNDRAWPEDEPTGWHFDTGQDLLVCALYTGKAFRRASWSPCENLTFQP